MVQLVERKTGDHRVASLSLCHRQWSHCVVSLSKTLYLLLSTGSIQEDPSRHDWKIVDWGVKNQTKPTKTGTYFLLTVIVYDHSRVKKKIYSWKYKRNACIKFLILSSQVNTVAEHFLLFGLWFNVPINSYGLVETAVHLTILFSWASLTKRLSSTSCMHILVFVTDNNPSWISGRRRMTVEIISWSISTKAWDQAGIQLTNPGSAIRLATNWATRPSSRGMWPTTNVHNSTMIMQKV